MSILGALALVYFIRLNEYESLVLNVLQKVESAGIYGQLIVVLVVAFSVIAILPTVILTLAAGYIYGAFYGSFLIVFGESIGALVAFLLARSGWFQSATTLIRNSKLLSTTNVVMKASGWELVSAIRMIPLFKGPLVVMSKS